MAKATWNSTCGISWRNVKLWSKWLGIDLGNSTTTSIYPPLQHYPDNTRPRQPYLQQLPWIIQIQHHPPQIHPVLLLTWRIHTQYQQMITLNCRRLTLQPHLTAYPRPRWYSAQETARSNTIIHLLSTTLVIPAIRRSQCPLTSTTSAISVVISTWYQWQPSEILCACVV